MERTVAAILALLLTFCLAGCTDEPSDLRSAPDSGFGTMDNSVGASYEEMLENARVHDTDGDLTDGENAQSDLW